MNTVSAKPSDLEERWYLVDAKDQVLGRLAARVAHVLRGKHLPNFTPHANMQTHVVVVNAGKVKMTGAKWADKTYYWHSGYRGGLKEITAEELLAKKPEELIRKAVWGMLPGNRLGRATMKRLRIFAGPNHRHEAQQPQPLEIHTRQAREEN